MKKLRLTTIQVVELEDSNSPDKKVVATTTVETAVKIKLGGKVTRHRLHRVLDEPEIKGLHETALDHLFTNLNRQHQNRVIGKKPARRA